MFIPAIALGLAMLAPAMNVTPTTDTETTPIDAAFLEVTLGMPEALAVCDSYGGIRDAIDGMAAIGVDSEAADMLVTMADNYLLVTLEGDTMRLTPEARVLFVDWLHADCAY